MRELNRATAGVLIVDEDRSSRIELLSHLEDFGVKRDFLGAVVVRDCNRNGSGLQSTEIWDQIICIYPPLQDRIICN